MSKTTTTGPLILTAPDAGKDRPEIFDLTAKCFGGHGYWNWLTTCRTWYFDHSHYDWTASRVGRIDGKMVTHWGTWGFDMRVGQCSVRVAGIGAVATDGSLRGRGLMARTAAAGIAGAAQAGYDMTLLYGINNFYHKYGYVRAWTQQGYKATVADLPAAQPPKGLRKFTPAHRDDLEAMYNAQAAGLTGTAVRPTWLCRQRLTYGAGKLAGYLWQAGGKVAGYVVIEPGGDNLKYIDSVGEPAEVMSVLAMLARKAGAREINLPNLHYHSPLARWLRANGCRVETKYIKSGGPMIRTLSLPNTLGKIAPELSRRLKASHLSDWKGTLTLTDARETVELAIAGGKVIVAPARASGKATASTPKHAIIGGENIAQLIIGAGEPDEVIAVANMKTTGQANKLAAVIFPNQHPRLEQWDGF